MKIKFYNFFCVIYLLNAFSIASPPGIFWTKLFGEKQSGCGYGGASGRSVQELSDGGYIVGGVHLGLTDSDIYLIRTDEKGDSLWTRSYGDLENDECLAVYETFSDKTGFMIIGGKWKGIEYSLSLIQTDLNGNTIWMKSTRVNGVNYSVKQTKDSGYILCSTLTDEDLQSCQCVVTKLNNGGDIEWSKTFREGLGLDGRSIDNTIDGGYIVTGVAQWEPQDTSSIDYFKILRLDSDGNLLWSKKYLGYPRYINSLNNGDFIISCDQSNLAKITESKILLLNNLIENNQIINKNKAFEYTLLLKGNPYIADKVITFLGNNALQYGQYEPIIYQDYTETPKLMRINGTGDIIWSKPYSVGSFDYAYLEVVEEVRSSGFFGFGKGERIVSDNVYYGDFLLRTDDNGDKLWERMLLGYESHSINGFDITDDGGFIITGGRDGQVFLSKFGADPTFTQNENHLLPQKFELKQNYPNPFNNTTKIDFTLPEPEHIVLCVYDALGKQISTLVSDNLRKGNHTFHFDGNNLASGTYYYQLVAGEFREVKKMILLR